MSEQRRSLWGFELHVAVAADDGNVNVYVAADVVDSVVVTELHVYVHVSSQNFGRDSNLNLHCQSHCMGIRMYIHVHVHIWLHYYITTCIIASLLATLLFNQNP